MNTVIFAEGGGDSTWGIEAAPPDRRRVDAIEQREEGFYVALRACRRPHCRPSPWPSS
jgi:hypothetical protein